MRLKVFHAVNMGAAMAMVRDELGPEALILASQADEAGVRVTAAMDQTDAMPTAEQPLARGRVDWSRVDEGSRSGRPAPAGRDADGFDDIPMPCAESLRWHGVPSAIVARLCRTDLATAIASAFKVGSIPLAPGSAPLLLVGPPGAGKTMAAARLATRIKLAGDDPLVITADGRRAGAAEQLAAFTRLLDLTLIVADAAIQLSKAVARRRGSVPVIIDMPGLNPFDDADRAYLADCRAATGAAIALVLPAGLDPGDAEDLALEFKQLGASALIASRLDQSRRLGGILAAAATGLVLTEAGTGSGVADGFTAITPTFLAKRLSVGRPAAARAPQPSVLAIMANPSGAKSRSNP